MATAAFINETKTVCKTIVTFIADTTKSSIKEIRDSNKYQKPFEFIVHTDNETDFAIFIKGNKTTGSNYEKTAWQECPVIKVTTNQTRDAEWWTEYQGIGTMYSGNETSLKYMQNGYLKELIDKSIKTAIEDFTEQQTL